MKCPGCGNDMEPRTRHGVTYDHCPSCGGVWLDRGEIDHLIEAVRPAVTLPDPTPPEPARKPAPPRPEAAGGKRYTPHPKRKPERHDDRWERPKKRSGKATRFGGRYSAKARLKDILEEIFDLD